VTDERVDVLLDELVGVLEEKLEHRRAVDQMVMPRQYELMAGMAALGVPKTGRGGIAVLVHDRLVARGWSEDEVAAAGISEGSVRDSIRRAR
jgi:hypothetical protein